ncbi:hypothetical protein SAMN02745126_06069 [Enhydrobacter aerosaccus]|uniref:Uncharacterized protein n=1 Tax=Enhydrobacter aerosaccus TaxID=225324 RepID=A0A1T4TE68_9HYPH|nr:hypothetical protein SAMN02745126_06069 [Enhydrobacter aerosaccus]
MRENHPLGARHWAVVTFVASSKDARVDSRAPSTRYRRTERWALNLSSLGARHSNGAIFLDPREDARVDSRAPGP